MKNEIKVSVIVPVYNTQPYLARCLDSLCAQTLKKMEVIVVNDGSTDQSLRIIEAYEKQFPERIRSFTQENRGLGAARNKGIANSEGEFIGFVDSDDCVEPDMYRRLYQEAVQNRSDIVACKYLRHKADGSIEIRSQVPCEKGIINGDEFLSYNYSVPVWEKIYRHDLIDNFKFPAIWYEDVAWTGVVMSYTDRICGIEYEGYHWFFRKGSIVSDKENPKTLDEIKAWRYALENCNKKKRNQVLDFIVKRALFAIKMRPNFEKEFADTLFNMRCEINNNPIITELTKKRLDKYINRNCL